MYPQALPRRRTRAALLSLGLLAACGGGGDGAPRSNKDGGDPAPLAMLGTTDEHLVEVDGRSGATRRVSSPGLTGYTWLYSLAFDQANDALYSIQSWNHTLLRIDAQSGELTALGDLDSLVGGIFNLAFDPQERVLFTVDENERNLYRIDPETRSVELVGKAGDSVFSCLAFDTHERVLYGVQQGQQAMLFRIDPSTAQVTLVGELLESAQVAGLTYHAAQQALYATHIGSNGYELITINPTNAGWMPIEKLPFGREVECLAYDAGRDELFGVTENWKLQRIDPVTAERDTLAVLGYEIAAMTHDVTRDRVYGIDERKRSMVAIDKKTGQAELIGSILIAVVNKTIEYDPVTDRIYAVAWNNQALVSYDPETYAGAQHMPLESDKDLRICMVGATMFGFEPQSHRVWTIDLEAKTMQHVGTLDVEGYLIDPTYDPTSGLIQISRRLSGADYDVLAVTPATLAWSATPSEHRIEGLAYDATDGEMLGNDAYGPLYSVGLASSVTVRSIGTLAPHAVEAITSDASGALYGLRDDELIAIDPDTGIFETVRELDFESRGLTTSGDPDRIVTFNVATSRLHSMSLASTAESDFGPSFASAASIAHDPKSSSYYILEDGGALKRLLDTGEVEPVGETGLSEVRGLSFDADKRVLYGVDASTQSIVRIDSKTAGVTVVATAQDPLLGLSLR